MKLTRQKTKKGHRNGCLLFEKRGSVDKSETARREHPANLLPSTLSVTTSFIAIYLTFRRSAYFGLAYAANNIVLIILWTLASMTNVSYMSVMICFVMFLVNDLYSFANWGKVQKRQLCGVREAQAL